MTESATTPRLALVGASGDLGRELRDCLYREGFPGAALELLDHDDQAGLVTEYGDEARVVMEAADEDLEGHELLCLCTHPETAARLAPRLAQSGSLVIDCTGAAWPGPGAQLVRASDAADLVAAGPGMLVVPHAATLLLGTLASALGDVLERASATVLLPASEHADAGPEELARQATGLLSFGELPEQLLGRRVAFDAFPTPEGTLERVQSEIAELQLPAPYLALLRASLFHGLAVSLHVPGLPPDSAAEQLGAAGILVAASGTDGRPLDSPGSIAGHAATASTRPRPDGRGGCWLWIVQDNYRAIAGIVTELAFAATGRVRAPR